jgi:hypothetical protein
MIDSAMESQSYEGAFRRYEEARLQYARLQEEIREFLARFTGVAASHEAPFVIRDLARMEGLRRERDLLFAHYTQLEKDIFDRLAGPWGGANER